MTSLYMYVRVLPLKNWLHARLSHHSAAAHVKISSARRPGVKLSTPLTLTCRPTSERRGVGQEI